jgi:hypothetical protein
MWHTDLHEIQVAEEATGRAYTKDLMAFLDHRPRFNIHHGLMPDKRSDTCATVLTEPFQLSAPPCILESDNGNEFTGGDLPVFFATLREPVDKPHPIAQTKTGRWNASGEPLNFAAVGTAIMSLLPISFSNITPSEFIRTCT